MRKAIFLLFLLLFINGYSQKEIIEFSNGASKEEVQNIALKNKKIEGSKITIITEKKFPLSDSWFKQVDFVVASPGLSPHIAKKSGLAQMLEITKKRKIPVVTELDLFDLANKMYVKKNDKNF